MVLIDLLFGQLMLLQHDRELLQDAAIESARFAALADQSPSSALAKARELISGAQAPTSLLPAAPRAIKVTLKLNDLMPLEAVGYAVLENQ